MLEPSHLPLFLKPEKGAPGSGVEKGATDKLFLEAGQNRALTCTPGETYKGGLPPKTKNYLLKIAYLFLHV